MMIPISMMMVVVVVMMTVDGMGLGMMLVMVFHHNIVTDRVHLSTTDIPIEIGTPDVL